MSPENAAVRACALVVRMTRKVLSWEKVPAGISRLALLKRVNALAAMSGLSSVADESRRLDSADTYP
ncbi:hypothetical protein D3C80_2110490 [compost metagenome]